MKPRNILLLFATTTLILNGCNKSPNKKAKDQKVTINMKSYMAQREDGYNLTFDYNNTMFDHSAKTFDETIKLLSFASSIVATTIEQATDFYETMSFDNFKYEGYEEITEDTIGYFIAHKNFKEYELVSVSIRGFDYQKEWSNNMIIGSEGNHQGFNQRAEEIYQSISTYISENYSENPIKLWISGYSRAGAISNVLADKLLRNEFVSADNLFVYTFEAPAGIAKENIVAYENVFNLVNKLDLITYIPPQEYDLGRCGIDVEIYDENISQLLRNFDYKLEIPNFTAVEEKYSTDEEFLKFFMDMLLEKISDEQYSLATRELYVNNYQDKLAYLIGLYFSLDQSTIDKIKAKAEGLSGWDYIALLADDGIYNLLLKDPLTEDEVPYDETKLKDASNALLHLITSHPNLFSEIVNLETQSPNQTFIDNLTRLIDMHYPESTYVLITK